MDFKIRDQLVDGLGPWVWPTEDEGAWEGPVSDWEESHKKTILQLCPQDKRRVAIQAGGNCGLYPVLLSKIFETVYTFEPDPENFKFLVENCKKHMCTNVFAINAAFGATDRTVEMVRHTNLNVGMHQVNDAVEGSVAMIRLDCINLDFDLIDLIWFDIEGYEWYALNGCEGILKQTQPVFGLERADQKCIDYLAGYGYNMAVLSKMDAFIKKQ